MEVQNLTLTEVGQGHMMTYFCKSLHLTDSDYESLVQIRQIVAEISSFQIWTCWSPGGQGHFEGQQKHSSTIRDKPYCPLP